MTITEKPTNAYNVIGTRPIRPDGLEKVTGQAIYGADVRLPGMVYGAVLRSPHAHANIKRIDTSKAASMPGVLAVITGADMPAADSKALVGGEITTSAKYASNQLMAHGKVLYKGHPVAAMAAVDLNTAIEATKLIQVEYEILKPVINVDDALAPDAPILHDDLVGDNLGEKVENTNLAKVSRMESGDVEAGFQASTIVLEREYVLATVHQGYIEPQVSTAVWQGDGRLSIWTSTQGAFGVRNATSGVLHVPESKIKVVPCEIGGGFGGKLSIHLEPIAAMLSKISGRPVQVVMDRKSVFEASSPAPGAKVKVKLGVDDSGKIKAGVAELWYEAGAFPGSSVGGGCRCIFGAYRMESLRIDGYDVVVNKPKSAAYRAPGAPQAAFAMESLVDEICETLKMDPLEFRLLNSTREGDRQPAGPSFPRVGGVEVQQAAKESPHWTSKLERQGPNGLKRGRGVATGVWFNGGFRSSVNMSVNSDGTVSLVEGSVDIGGSRASISMQAAEVLGIPAEDVRPTVADTESVGYNDNTAGSRTTNASGHAAYNAAQEALTKMAERAAKVWDIKPEEVQFEDAVFSAKSDPELRLTFKEVAAKFRETGGPVNATGATMVAGGAASFGTAMVDVEVDPETGKVDVIRCTMVQDAGKAIHPAYVEGQMQGGVVQGIGWALNEEYYMSEQGSMENSTFLDYRMPTTLDMPMVETIIVEVPNPRHPFGVRGVGETSIIPTLAAVANAVYDAVGVRFPSTPIKPGRILEALDRQQNGG